MTSPTPSPASSPTLPLRTRFPLLMAGLARRPAFWVSLVLFGIVLPSVALVNLLRAGQQAPEVYSTLPTFRFQSQEAQPFGSAELQGKVWVANFIFTRCPTVCPRFSSEMAKVQARTAGLGEPLQLVSFSVDPEYDTPERLKAYGQKFKADPTRWTFLTGDYNQLRATVVDGFKVAMGKETPATDELASIFHGEYFVLVDRQGGIRGYYDFNDANAVERLVHDAERLQEEAPSRS